MRACVESLTKGPAIQANDKDSLLCYADTAKVTYDTLQSMGYLSQMKHRQSGEGHCAAAEVDAIQICRTFEES